MGEQTVTRKLAAIFYADVDGYSRLTGADEEGTHKTLGEHLDLITTSVKNHRGRVVHFAGDAVLAEFDSVVDAVICATDAQKALRQRNSQLPDGRKLQFRIGINLGDVIVDRNDIFGDGVNVAARLESIAEPGGIVVSGTVFQQAKNKVQSIFDDLGEHNFKNIAEPVRAYRIRIDPDDQLIHIANPIRRAFWRGAMIAAGIILVLEIAAFGTWYQFIRKSSPIEIARKTSAELQARLKLNPLPQKMEPGTIFRECADCPEMMVVPAGGFMMGAAAGERGAHGDEGPLHEVRIEAPFAIGRFEVTYAEWDACVASNGCNYSPQDRGWGRGNLPVTYVNWADIQSYLIWLSSLTGHHYRLPSEAEWEYAARAGSPSSFSWGEKMVSGYANCAGCGTASGDRTMPVGSLKPNAFDLFDMHGNVWEWTADCWNGSFANAPRNGTVWNVGDCDFRVLKGGAWGHEPNDLRSARRIKDKLDLRSGRRGFRVVTTLP